MKSLYHPTAVSDVKLTRSDATIPGTLAFAESVTGFTVGEAQYDWVFTPESANYTELTGTVTITAKSDDLSSIAVTTAPGFCSSSLYCS